MMWPKATLHHNSHKMVIEFDAGIHGELVEYYLWCHTCNPTGSKMIAKVDMETWPLSTESAVLNLFSHALSHARYESDGAFPDPFDEF